VTGVSTGGLAGRRPLSGRGGAGAGREVGAPPLGPGTVDVVIASQVLHHLPRELAVRWIASFDRVARRAVVLADLRRSRLAMAGVWMASFGLGFRRQTRHDAVVSLRRGYPRRERNAMLPSAGVPEV